MDFEGISPNTSILDAYGSRLGIYCSLFLVLLLSSFPKDYLSSFHLLFYRVLLFSCIPPLYDTISLTLPPPFITPPLFFLTLLKGVCFLRLFVTSPATFQTQIAHIDSSVVSGRAMIVLIKYDNIDDQRRFIYLQDRIWEANVSF